MARSGMSPRVAIIGAGPAGMRAAERLVAAGLRPLVVDEARRSGGQIYRRPPENFTRKPGELYGFEARKAVRVHGAFDAIRPRIDDRPDTLVWAIQDHELYLLSDNRISIEPFDALILAVGATDRIMPVPGWTLPGVTTLGGAQIALKAQGCVTGARPIFVGTGPLLYYAAYEYAKVGIRPAAVLDTSTFAARLAATPKFAARPKMLVKGLYYTAVLKARGVPLHSGVTPLAIEGDGRIERFRYRDAAGHERAVEGDALALGYGLRSETQLADLAGCDFAFDPLARQWLPATDADGRTSVKGVYLAGDGARIAGADAAEIAGRLAACALIADHGLSDVESEAAGLRARMRPMLRFRQALEQAFAWPHRFAAELPDETLVCRCEAITVGELRRTARELSVQDVNRAKAFSRVGMGRCQGRFCGLAGAEVLAAALDAPVEAVGRLRGQAPVKPLPASVELSVELGAEAGTEVGAEVPS